MSESNLSSSLRLVGSPAWLWRYAATQWRRAFGVNVSRVDELLFVGGEFRAEQWPRLYALGVRAVLNLQAEREDEFAGPEPLRTLRLPVIDFYAPAIEQLHEATAFICSAQADGLPVLIHCHAGVGRAPLTAAAFLMTQGLSPTAALERVRRARPIAALNRRQQDRLAEWARVVARR